MNNKEMENVEVSALLDTAMYILDKKKVEGKNLGEYIASLDLDDYNNYSKLQLEVLQKPENLEILDKYTILDTSWQTKNTDGSNRYNPGTSAAVFTKGKEVYVAYRGTSDGEWVDNPYAYAGIGSPQQKEALDYFDHVVEEYNLTSSQNLTITGHSKGGNDAQYTTLNSEYGYLIDKCISIDGQGFSPEAIIAMKKQYGREYYDEQLAKMYSICGENDYVNPQGGKVIKEDHTYYIPTPNAEGFGDYHEIAFLFQNGELGELDPNGQGPLGEYAAKLSEMILQLPEEQRAECAMSIMALCEKFMGKEYTDVGINGEWADEEDVLGFIVYGVPTILQSVGTEEGMEVVTSLLGDMIQKYYDENGFLKTVGMAYGVSLATVVLGPWVITIGGSVYRNAWMIESVINKIKSVKEFTKEVGQNLDELYQSVVGALQKVGAWFFAQTYGYQYATENTYIHINTTRMRDLATQLGALSQRSKALDKKMNRLYWNLGIDWDTLWNLGRLLKGEVVLDYAYRLDRCVSFLENTAQEFEEVEKEIKGYVGG